MLNGLISDAYRILSESYKKIGDLGVKSIDEENGLRRQATINKLITCTRLYRVVMRHIILNDDGTAIVGTKNQTIPVINDLLSQLKKAAGLYRLPAFPTPLSTYQFNFGDSSANFDVSGGQLGDLIQHNGSQFVRFPMGAPGTVPVATPSGVQWQSVVGNGIPSGGSTNQVLYKVNNTSYNVAWKTLGIADIADITASASEINILDGVVGVSAAEISYLSNVTDDIQTQIDGKLGTSLLNGKFYVGNGVDIATAVTPTGDVVFSNTGVFAISNGVIVNADINASAAIARSKIASGAAYRIVVNDATGVMIDAAAITADMALISNSNGIPIASSVSAATLALLDATSSVQDQLDARLEATLTSPVIGDMLYYDGSTYINFGVGAAGEVITSNGTIPVWGSAAANGLPTGGNANEVLRKIDNTNYNTEWHLPVFADNTDVTTTADMINLLDGLTADASVLNYSTGLTDFIQTQLDQKLPIALNNHAIWVGGASNTAQQVSPGVNGSVFTIVAGHPTWQTPPAPGDVSGPVSSTDNAIVRWDGTTGALLQNSGNIMDDLNNIIFGNGAGLQTGVTAGNTLKLQAYDVDGAAYTTFATLTANNSPTFDLASAVTIGTAYIYRAGGTDVALADGGTGASLSDPGFHAAMIWDDTNNIVRFASLVNLTYDPTGNTLTASGSGPVPNTYVDCGTWDFTSDLFPTTGGTGTAGAIARGNTFEITDPSTSPIGPDGGVIPAGVTIRALTDTPGQTLSNWVITVNITA